MYFEEKIIEGVLYWRASPCDNWQPYTNEQAHELAWMRQKHVSEMAVKLSKNFRDFDNWFSTIYPHGVDGFDYDIADLKAAFLAGCKMDAEKGTVVE